MLIPTFRRSAAPRVETLPTAVPDAQAVATALGEACPAAMLSDGSEREHRDVLALAPRGWLFSRQGRSELRWEGEEGARLAAVAGLEALRSLLEGIAPATPTSAAPAGGGSGTFSGGVVLALAHDIAREIETLPAPPEDRDGLPWLVACACPAALSVDSRTGRAELAWIPAADGADGGEDGADDGAPWGLAVDEIDLLRRRLSEAITEAGRGRAAPPGGPSGPIVDLMDADGYRRMVARVHEHLLDGNVYQANVGQRFEVPWRGSAIPLFEALRRSDPAPQSGWLRVPASGTAPAFELVSSSPERLVRRTGRELVTEPIAGTWPLPSGPGAAESEVAAAIESLARSAKDAAEHVMIVDLHRNDLGAVSTPGTVRVVERMRPDRRAHLVQAVAEIRGELEEGRDAVAVLRAMVPAGCVTGVPKARCLEVIDEVEPCGRGFWTGAFGWIGVDGDLDLSVLIRCAWLARGRLSFAAGGGVVIDSRAESERLESLAKVRAIREAVSTLTAGES